MLIYLHRRFSTIIRKIYASEKILFFLSSLFFTFEYWIFGPASYARLGDNLDSFIARVVSFWHLIFRDGISYWYPIVAGGIDRLSNDITYSQISSVVFALPSPWLAYVIVLAGTSFIAGYFTFKLCHGPLGLRRGVSVFAGLLFSSSFVIEDLLFFRPGLSLFPVVLYVGEMVITKPKWKFWHRCLASVGIGLLYGFGSSMIYTLPFALCFLFLWFLFIRKHISVNTLMFLFLFSICALALQAQEIRGLITQVPLSQRGAQEIYYQGGLSYYIAGIRKYVTLHWLSILILLSGPLFLRIRQRLFWWFASICAALLLIAPAYQPLSASLLGNFFAPVRNYDFSRFILFFPFFAALGSAWVIEEIHGTVVLDLKHRIHQISFSKIIVVAILIFILLSNVSQKSYRLLAWYGNGGFKTHTYSPELADLARTTQDMSPFRVATLTQTYKPTLLPTLANFFGFETIDGNANIAPRRFIDFFRLITGDPSITTSLYLLWQASDETWNVAEKNLSNVLDLDLLSLANVKYLISLRPINAPGFVLVYPDSLSTYPNRKSKLFFERFKIRLDENFNGRHVLVYENTNVFSRFYLTKNIRTFETDADLLAAMEKATTTTLRAQAFVVKSSLDETWTRQLSGVQEQVEIRKYAPDEILLRVTSDGPSILVITNNYHPLWTAYVNGKQERVIPAYHTFMGIFLPEGTSDVLLRYEPAYATDVL